MSQANETPSQTAKKLLSEEWNKPKEKNIKGPNDKRSPRNYSTIKDLQKEIKDLKPRKK